MAMHFGLAAECGPERETVEKFSAYFKGLQLKLSDGIETKCETGVWKDPEDNWWGYVSPPGMSLGVNRKEVPDLSDSRYTTEIGFLLYERLKTSPPFRFAMIGWEVDETRYFSELNASDLEHPAFNGLVLSEEVWKHLGYPSNVEPFVKGYFWKPYQGEVFNPPK